MVSRRESENSGINPEDVSFENIDEYLEDVIRRERREEREGEINPRIYSEAVRRYIKHVNDVLDEEVDPKLKRSYNSGYFQRKTDSDAETTVFGSCLQGLSYLSNYLEGLEVEKENHRGSGSDVYDFSGNDIEKMRELERNIELRKLPEEEADLIEEILRDEGSLKQKELVAKFEEELGYEMTVTRLKNRIGSRDKVQKTDGRYRYIETRSL
ncbi:MAG: hypothetical protein ABEJ95_06010 [Candidatus Nanohalobium sp.]